MPNMKITDVHCHCFTEDQQMERAFYLGLAALLGKGVYNFGELASNISNISLVRFCLICIMNYTSRFMLLK